MKEIEKVEGVSLVHGRRIPTVKVGGGSGASGTPEEFEQRFAKSHLRKRQPEAPQPKLKEIENHSMAERLAQVGIQEEV